jgi:hypothetical protein
MVSPGKGTPMLSAITPKKTRRYPYWEMRWRMPSIRGWYYPSLRPDSAALRPLTESHSA